MSDVDANKITAAATTVMTALEPLTIEERARVLQAAAALHGIGLKSSPLRGQGGDGALNGGGGGGHEEEDPDNEPGTGKRLSIVEFLRRKAPATNAQRLAAFAYYREHFEEKPRFARGDLEHYFSSAKLAKPGNYDRDFSGAVREGWIHEDGSESYLTQDGEEAVNAGFGGKAKPRGQAVAGKKKTSAAGD